MNWKRIAKKAVILAIIFFLIGAITNVVDPIVKNTLAMRQMDLDTFSNTWIFVYQRFVNWYPFIAVVLSLLVFKNDILELIQKNKGEKEHEED